MHPIRNPDTRWIRIGTATPGDRPATAPGRDSRGSKAADDGVASFFVRMPRNRPADGAPLLRPLGKVLNMDTAERGQFATGEELLELLNRWTGGPCSQEQSEDPIGSPTQPR